MELKKDRRWDGWPGITEDYFSELGRNLILRREVPDPIHQQFKGIKSLLRSCYFDYELISVVYLLLGIAFEASLRLKYAEVKKISEEKSRRPSLNKLIEWGDREGLFEEDFYLINTLRDLRNEHVHQIKPVLYGFPGMRIIIITRDVINGIFDPLPELREKRKLKSKRLNFILQNLSRDGLILHWKGHKLPILTAYLLLYNNLTKPARYYVSLWPIFEIDDNSDETKEGKPINLCCDRITYKSKPEKLIKFNDETWITPIVNPDGRKKFDRWLRQFKSHRLLPFLVNHKLGEMRAGLMAEYIYLPTPETISGEKETNIVK